MPENKHHKEYSEADRLELEYFKKIVKSPEVAHNVSDEPRFHSEFNRWFVDRFDPASGNVLNEFGFKDRAAADEAVAFAVELAAKG